MVALATAAMEAGKLRERRRQRQSLGDFGLHWEGKECEVAIFTPPQVYIGPFVAAEKSPCQIFAILSEFGLLAFLKSQKF